MGGVKRWEPWYASVGRRIQANIWPRFYHSHNQVQVKLQDKLRERRIWHNSPLNRFRKSGILFSEEKDQCQTCAPLG